MKLSVALLFVFFFANSSWSQSIMTFERIFVKVDTMAQNSTTIHRIKFTNTGNKSLVITGCTPENPADKCVYDKKAIAPGAVAYINYQPDSAKCGKYARNLTVTTKDGETITLHLKGVILCADEKKAGSK